MSIKQEIKEECDISMDEQSLEIKPECFDDNDWQTNVELPETIKIEEESSVRNEENNDISDSLLVTLKKSIYESLKNEINNHAVQPVDKIKIEDHSLSDEQIEVAEENSENLDESYEAPGPRIKEPHKCTACNYVTNIKRNLTAHSREEHNVKTYFCKSCDFGLLNEASLKIHSRTHRNKKRFRCNFCKGKSFTIKCNFVQHMMIYHPGESLEQSETYQCDKCLFETLNEFSLQTHVCKFAKRKKFTCPICGHDSYSKRDFRHHFANHEPLKCDHCEFTCKRKLELRSHMRKDHPELMLHCDKCEYKTCVLYYLKMHIKIHHLRRQKKFKCSFCDFTTHYKQNWKFHVVKHTGDAIIFKCSSCDYSTYHETSFERHLVRHRGDRPFPCNLCEYNAKRKQCLQTHVKRRHENIPN